MLYRWSIKFGMIGNAGTRRTRTRSEEEPSVGRRQAGRTSSIPPGLLLCSTYVATICSPRGRDGTLTFNRLAPISLAMACGRRLRSAMFWIRLAEDFVMSMNDLNLFFAKNHFPHSNLTVSSVFCMAFRSRARSDCANYRQMVMNTLFSSTEVPAADPTDSVTTLRPISPVPQRGVISPVQMEFTVYLCKLSLLFAAKAQISQVTQAAGYFIN